LITYANRRITPTIIRHSLTPEQVKAGTGKVRTYKDWENLFKNPEVGGKLGVSHLFSENNQG
jgi:hypothetical protein